MAIPYDNNLKINGVIGSKTLRPNSPLNITGLENTYKEAFNKWWNEDKSDMKSFVQYGKVLSLRINESRKKKYQYVGFKDFVLNISKIPCQISHEELTKTRFFTLLHRFIHRKYLEETDETQKDSFKVSALVVKVNFTPDSCLTPIRFLLGTGFEYQHDIVIKDKDDLVGKLTFIIGCMVLDWFSGRSKKNPRNSKLTKYNSFKEYALSEDTLYGGGVLLAGARGIGDKELKFLKNKSSLTALESALDHITFNMNRSVASQGVEAICNRLREEFEKSEKNKLVLAEKFGTLVKITE